MADAYAAAVPSNDARRIDLVKDIFSTITGRYDFLNHLLSLRQDIAWRRFAVRRLRFFKTWRFIDMACGTGDLAIEATARYSGIQVIGLDFAQAMLDRARQKAEDKGFSGRVRFIRGDVLCAPLPGNSFDAAGMAFGIRNIPDKLNALKEVRRVVVPGGQVLILELSLPQSGLFRRLYDLYLNRLLPRIAAIYSSNSEAYQYLAESVMDFPSVADFARIMQEAGWEDVRAYALTLGVCCLFVGRKTDRRN